MTKTANYQLNQWEPADKLSREDFNSDNAAIDAALKAGAAELAAVSQSVSDLATQVANGVKIAVGSYVGNGGTQTIGVGFTPKAVFVHNNTAGVKIDFHSGLAVANANYGSAPHLAIVTGGFSVTAGDNAALNFSLYAYNYLAIG